MLLFENGCPRNDLCGSLRIFFLVTFLFGALQRTARRARRAGQYFREDKSVK